MDNHFTEAIAAHEAICDVQDCPVSAALRRRLSDSDSSGSSDDSDSSADSSADSTSSDSSMDTPVPAPVPDAVVRVPRDVGAIVKEFYDHLGNPGVFSTVRSPVTFFDGCSLAGRSPGQLAGLIHQHQRGIIFGTLEQNHRILHIGNSLIVLLRDHGYTWARVKEEFDLQPSTAGAYKTFTSCVLKYPKLGLVSMAWRNLKTRVKAASDFIDELDDNVGHPVYLRKSFWTDVPDYIVPGDAVPVARPIAGRVAGPIAGRVAGPIAGRVARPVARPIAGRIAGPVARPVAALIATPAGHVPVAGPIPAPVSAAVAAPVAGPIASPVSAAVAGPVAAPVSALIAAAVAGPIAATVSAAVAGPIAAPVSATVTATIPAPVAECDPSPAPMTPPTSPAKRTRSQTRE
jgi:hypothetical protein